MAFPPAKLAKEAGNEVLTHRRGAGPELRMSRVLVSPVTQFFCFLPYEQQLSPLTRPSGSPYAPARPGSLYLQALKFCFLLIVSHLLSLYKSVWVC